MSELRFTTRIKRVGERLAVMIPANEARIIGLGAGQSVKASIRVQAPHPLGLAKDLEYEPFSREEFWR